MRKKEKIPFKNLFISGEKLFFPKSQGNLDFFRGQRLNR